MVTTTLRHLGGSVVMPVPKKILDFMPLSAGAKVEMSVEHGKLIVQPTTKPKYTLTDLLTQCQSEDFQLTEDDRVWLDAKPVGKEVW
jgi:antitoxin ChpS